jgi:hypothetical protein
MLTYAGEELLFPTIDIVDFFERNQPLEDLSQFSEQTASMAAGRHSTRIRPEHTHGFGLPVYNWPAPPQPRLNTIWWPTGATRWARAWFLVTRETRDKIISKVHKGGSLAAKTLSWGDDSDQSSSEPLEAEMYLLSPRQISSVYNDQEAWLLPLVDERYFWQFLNGGDLTDINKDTTWDELISELTSALGITASTTVPSAYLKPDPIEFSRPRHSAAMLFDAVLCSIGQRLVRDLDGTIHLQTVEDATSTLDDNLALDSQQLAGGQFSDLSGDLPDSINIAFRRVIQKLIHPLSPIYSVNKTKPSTVTTTITKRPTINCAAIADYNVYAALQNTTALDTLAGQIRDDFYGWAKKDYDITYAGVVPWSPSGFDDAILWSWGRPHGPEYGLSRNAKGDVEGLTRASRRIATTRVQTLPSNFWSELNACSDSSKEIIGGPKGFGAYQIADDTYAHNAWMPTEGNAGNLGGATLNGITDDRYNYAVGMQLQDTPSPGVVKVFRAGIYQFVASAWIINSSLTASLDATLRIYRVPAGATDFSGAVKLPYEDKVTIKVITVAGTPNVIGVKWTLHGHVYLDCLESLAFRVFLSDVAKTVDLTSGLFTIWTVSDGLYKIS